MSINQMQLVKVQIQAVQTELRRAASRDLFPCLTEVEKLKNYDVKSRNTQLLYTLKDSLVKYLDGWIQLQENSQLALKNTEDALKNTEGALKNTEGALKNTEETLLKYNNCVKSLYHSCLTLVSLLEEASKIKYHNSSPAKETSVQYFRQIWVIVDEMVTEIVSLVESVDI